VDDVRTKPRNLDEPAPRNQIQEQCGNRKQQEEVDPAAANAAQEELTPGTMPNIRTHRFFDLRPELAAKIFHLLLGLFDLGLMHKRNIET